MLGKKERKKEQKNTIMGL